MLAKRRAQLEAAGAKVLEPAPAAPRAGAPHLEGLSFGAPPLGKWLAAFKTPEEDRMGELLAEGVRERGPVPMHAPRPPSAAEVAQLQGLAQELAQLQEQLRSERQSLGGAREVLSRREADVWAKERALEAEREEQRRREEERRRYPPPPWLSKVAGTINVGVVGNSGVGKSLLINRLRKLRPCEDGWAAVGVKETTKRVSMYAFPNERRVRLWDFPGAGTPAFPLETYIARMGLKYLDKVVVVTAGRFTQTEAALRAELEAHRVPYCMVRTKVDIDVWNNQEDNCVEEAQTLELISQDLRQHCGGARPYLVSLRDSQAYDFPRLLAEVFPCLRRERRGGGLGAPGWDDAWALPAAHSPTVTGLQGRWTDGRGTYFLVQDLQVHVTVPGGLAAAAALEERDGYVWWLGRWRLDMGSVRRARRSGQLRWQSAEPGCSAPMFWHWSD